MSLIQGKYGKRGATAINPSEAGVVACVIYELDMAAQAVNTTDIVELGPFPAFAKLIDMTVLGVGVGAITATVGMLNGEAGNPDNARALVGGTSNVITAGSIAASAEAPASKLACIKLPVAQDHRGIGVTLSANEAAGAGKKLYVTARYTY